MALVFPSTPTPGQTYVGPNNITYTWDNALGIWTGSSPGAGGLTAASPAQAAAGTLNTVASTPQTAVPKDASGMTGAALIPTGTTLQQPATPVGGMLRMNTTYSPDSLEVYDGTAATWRSLSYANATPTGLTDLTISANGPLNSGVYNNVTINAGVTATISGLTSIRAYGAVTINGSINGDGTGAVGFSLGVGGVSTDANINAGLGLGYGGFASYYPSGSPSYSFRSLSGSTGGSGTVGPRGGATTAGSTGGNSGATLVIEAEGPIVVAATSTIAVNGTAGSTAASGGVVIGGGGGGSGGLILLQSSASLTLAAGSTLSVVGGSGSNGVNTAAGGGGGGGGYIVLNSPSTTDSSTKTLTGGSAGANSGTARYAGNGGSFGGSGGVGGGSTAPTVPTNGGTGQILLNQYL